MSESFYHWWKSNGGIMLVLAVQAAMIIVWGVRLDSRVQTIETRGSPQLDIVERRLGVFEDRQRYVLETLKINSGKLDSISEELKRHELGTNNTK